ncbi:MAG: tRNA (adenosine(37)-N6)-threonylcarbamoyltransferase complex ATPase subunit type 1 TsaE, partial [Campylobacterales bacterium]|nr:tRNA (adenosine(37)-N6)-threonylcarbamoyltransferase complex ATPase subunit type 1 TsaE [Campylobacterales bacterium]
MIFKAKEPKDLKPVSDYLIENYKDGTIVLLNGDLGAGKSTFVKEFSKSLGITETSSPTFSIMNNYQNKVYHYDIYRTGSDEFFSLGLGEELDNSGFHFIEWADEKIEKYIESVGFESIKMTITPKNNLREVE